MPTYDEACKRFDENGCKFLTSRESYEGFTGKEKMKMKVEFIAKCQHHNTVTLVNFWCKKSGLICKDCMYKNVGQKLKAQHYNDECSHQEQELVGIKLIASIIDSEFYVQKTNEGCLADMLVKPKYEMYDKWALVQIKTTKGLSHDLYTFSMKGNAYTNCYIICISLSDERLWMFDYKILSGQNNLNIGKTSKSEFYQYECAKDEICSKLHVWYAECRKFNMNIGMKPISVCQQQEQEYRKFRERMLPFLTFKYPEVDGRKTDFYINGFSIQEKVATKIKNRKYSYCVFMHRNRKSVDHKYLPYKKGDNSFYWFWLPDNKDMFYLFPESVLVEHLHINVANEINKTRISISKDNWTKDFCYSLNNDALQEKLETLFEVNQ
jgi:hypothetical protein